MKAVVTVVLLGLFPATIVAQDELTTAPTVLTAQVDLAEVLQTIDRRVAALPLTPGTGDISTLQSDLSGLAALVADDADVSGEEKAELLRLAEATAESPVAWGFQHLPEMGRALVLIAEAKGVEAPEPIRFLRLVEAQRRGEDLTPESANEGEILTVRQIMAVALVRLEQVTIETAEYTSLSELLTDYRRVHEDGVMN
jgi:hypothetical protein